MSLQKAASRRLGFRDPDDDTGPKDKGTRPVVTLKNRHPSKELYGKKFTTEKSTRKIPLGPKAGSRDTVRFQRRPGEKVGTWTINNKIVATATGTREEFNKVNPKQAAVIEANRAARPLPKKKRVHD